MNTIQSQSYSLLSQEEIDVLVDFLNAKKGSVNSDVMSQKSIDKLIYLITSDKQQIIKDLCNPLNDVKFFFIGDNAFPREFRRNLYFKLHDGSSDRIFEIDSHKY